MGYIDQNLLQDERIVFRTKKHLIVFFFPVVWTLFSLYAYDYMHSNFILSKLDWLPFFVALIFWSYVGLNYLTSDFAVTNKRVMMREGFFYRRANELRLTAISQVNVDQSLLGQMLHYGTVSINAFGAYDTYTLIARPIPFQKAIQQKMDQANT